MQIARALVALNHESSHLFISRFFDLFNDQDVALDAALAIGKIPSSNEVLLKQNNAQLRVSVCPTDPKHYFTCYIFRCYIRKNIFSSFCRGLLKVSSLPEVSYVHFHA